MAKFKNTVINDTGAIKIASGNNEQRPSADLGVIRHNSESKTIEVYEGNSWSSLIQIGSVELFALSSAPAGWLACNGAAVSRTAYSNLFSIIETNFGDGDGSTTFNIPDYRAIFPRSWDDGRGVDNNRSISSVQAQSWKGFWQNNTLRNVSSGYSHGPVYMGKTIHASFTGNLFVGRWSAPAAAWGTAWDASEVRPRNNTLLACIKY